jgi:hypothetical protein
VQAIDCQRSRPKRSKECRRVDDFASHRRNDGVTPGRVLDKRRAHVNPAAVPTRNDQFDDSVALFGGEATPRVVRPDGEHGDVLRGQPHCVRLSIDIRNNRATHSGIHDNRPDTRKATAYARQVTVAQQDHGHGAIVPDSTLSCGLSPHRGMVGRLSSRAPQSPVPGSGGSGLNRGGRACSGRRRAARHR